MALHKEFAHLYWSILNTNVAWSSTDVSWSSMDVAYSVKTDSGLYDWENRERVKRVEVVFAVYVLM